MTKGEIRQLTHEAKEAYKKAWFMYKKMSEPGASEIQIKMARHLGESAANDCRIARKRLRSQFE